MHQNSLDAHEEIKEIKNTCRRKVFEVIAKHKAVTAQEIADRLKWGINCVTPRICELKLKGSIVEAGNTKNKKGFTVTVYAPVDGWGGVL